MDFKLDMSMMFAMHDALRRELVQVGALPARAVIVAGMALYASGLAWWRASCRSRRDA